MSLRTRSQDSGFALVSTLLALALLTTVGVSLLAMGTVEVKSSANHRSATRALLLADAAASHALALMRGPLNGSSYSEILLGADGVWGTADDGVLAGFGLSVSDALPDTGFLFGEGRYFVTIANDPGDPSADPSVDDNYRVIATCRGELEDGGVAEIGIVLAAPAYPALATNGDLFLPGNPDILGPCAGVHVNGVLTVVDNPTVDGEVTVTDSVIMDGVITDSAGYVVVPKTGEPPLEVPEYYPSDYCNEADYFLRNGWVVTVGPPMDSTHTMGGPVHGWHYDKPTNLYSVNGNQAVPGTVCAYGNVKLTGNTGSEGAPLSITILANGSVEIGGTPKIQADHSEGYLIVATGDVKISGNASGTTPNFEGLIYAGSQCQVNGTPAVEGYLLCHDAPDPAGAIDLTAVNIVNGDPRIAYDCTGVRRQTLLASWWESRAQ